jgi:hypothetical protein
VTTSTNNVPNNVPSTNQIAANDAHPLFVGRYLILPHNKHTMLLLVNGQDMALESLIASYNRTVPNRFIITSTLPQEICLPSLTH